MSAPITAALQEFSMRLAEQDLDENFHLMVGVRTWGRLLTEVCDIRRYDSWRTQITSSMEFYTPTGKVKVSPIVPFGKCDHHIPAGYCNYCS